MGNMGRIAENGDVYAFYIEELGKYGTCQILDVWGGSLCYILLDYLGEEVPSENDLKEIKPFYKECYINRHRMVKQVIDKLSVPGNYIYIGKIPLVVTNCRDGSYFNDVWQQGTDYIFEERWKAAGNEAQRNYKKYINSGEFVRIKKELVKKNKDCLDNDLYKLLDDNSSLCGFPCIISADVHGYSQKLVNLIKTSPLLHSLKLSNTEADIVDLRGTGLYNIETDITGVNKIILPEEIYSLVIYGNIKKQLCIYGNPVIKDKGIILDIHIKNIKEFPGIIFKDVKIRELNIDNIKELDIEIITRYFPDIKKISLTGSPGIITNIHKMEFLKNLQTIGFYDIFGYNDCDVKIFGQLEELREIDFYSVPKTAGKYIKKHWENRLDVLSVKSMRDSGWLADNIDNPLRKWDGSGFVPAAAYKRSFKCYKDTKKLLLNAENSEDVIEIVRQYTRNFNELNRKYGQFIETEEREDIFMAMEQLYKECILGKSNNNKSRNTTKDINITLEEVLDVIEENKEDW